LSRLSFPLYIIRSVQRLEAVARSPIFGQLSSSLNGLTTVRAFKAEEMLNSEFVRIQNVHSSSWFASLALGRWFAVSLDWTLGGKLNKYN
jgi:ATP-binding cassette subfamily C (CFTR/MRP) protein 4